MINVLLVYRLKRKINGGTASTRQTYISVFNFHTKLREDLSVIFNLHFYSAAYLCRFSPSLLHRSAFKSFLERPKNVGVGVCTTNLYSYQTVSTAKIKKGIRLIVL